MTTTLEVFTVTTVDNGTYCVDTPTDIDQYMKNLRESIAESEELLRDGSGDEELLQQKIKVATAALGRESALRAEAATLYPHVTKTTFTLTIPTGGQVDDAEDEATDVDMFAGTGRVNYSKRNRILLKNAVEGLTPTEVEALPTGVRDRLKEKLLRATFPTKRYLDFLPCTPKATEAKSPA